MSPGATFERVYLELKRKLGEGTWPPGTPLEPAILGHQLAASITPVRDALHRLTGERLVEAPNHNGFRVPLLTEAALRDLYQWNGQVLGLAARSVRFDPSGTGAAVTGAQDDLWDATAELFLRVARATDSSEHVAALTLLNDRLAPFRRIESALLDDLTTELEQLGRATENPAQLARLLTAYHRRRTSAVPDILTYTR